MPWPFRQQSRELPAARHCPLPVAARYLDRHPRLGANRFLGSFEQRNRKARRRFPRPKAPGPAQRMTLEAPLPYAAASLALTQSPPSWRCPRRADSCQRDEFPASPRELDSPALRLLTRARPGVLAPATTEIVDTEYTSQG